MRWLLCTAVALAAAGGLIGAAQAHHSPVDPPAATVVVVSWSLTGTPSVAAPWTGTTSGRIRLRGLNAPEVAHDDRPQQCSAAQARDRIAQLAPVGSSVVAAW